VVGVLKVVLLLLLLQQKKKEEIVLWVVVLEGGYPAHGRCENILLGNLFLQRFEFQMQV
jgi:hypothetical protein